MVGRDPEIAHLERALNESLPIGSGVLEIAGEPGIGKSRLLAELARRAEARGWLVLDGRATEFERDIPFGVVVDALNDRARRLTPSLLRSLDDETVRELAALLPSLAGLVDEPLSIASARSATGRTTRSAPCSRAWLASSRPC